MFNSNEHAVIRTYIAVTGEAPTQAQFEGAFDFSGLRTFSADLVSARPAQSDSAFITNLYEQLLNRAPDSAGFEYWSALLSVDEISQARLAVEFQNSAAVNAANEPAMEDGTIGLTAVHGEFIGQRVPSAGQSEAAEMIATSVGESPDEFGRLTDDPGDNGVEFSNDERAVIRAYVALTGDAPGQAEFESVFDDCSGFGRLCNELAEAHAELSDTEFVKTLYRNLLNREPDLEGLTYWRSFLEENDGWNVLSRGGVAMHFQNTAALNAANESGLVTGTFGLEPTGAFFDPIVFDEPIPDAPPEDIVYLGEFDGQTVDLSLGKGEHVRLVYEGYDNGGVAVTNFIQDNDGETGNSAAGIDHIDFTDYLVTWVALDSVCHPLSRAPVEFYDQADALLGNTVSIITFQGPGEAEEQNWQNLDASDLVALLNGESTYGDAANSIEFGGYRAGNSSESMEGYLGGIEGNINDHIFMVEDGEDAGTYKIFHVTSTRVEDAEAGNFDSGAKLVGVLDLGTSLSTNELDMEASLVGATEWAAALV